MKRPAIPAPPERFEHLWSDAGPDYAVDGGMLSGEYYILRDVPVDAIKVTEGSLFIAERKDFPSLAEECSPSVTASLEQFFNRVDRATLVGLSMLYQTLRSVSDNHVHLDLRGRGSLRRLTRSRPPSGPLASDEAAARSTNSSQSTAGHSRAMAITS